MITDCYGRQEIQSFVPPAHSVLISMVDPHTDFPTYQTGWEAILQLQFWDIIRNKHYNGALGKDFLDHAPSRNNTRKIYQFIVDHQDKNIYAHCEAGISRSGAVREFLNRMGWHVQTPTRLISPNLTILTDLLRDQYRQGKISF